MERPLVMGFKVDILILSANFGNGHLSASLGIKEHVHNINPKINIKTVDIFHVLIPKLSRLMYKGYKVLVKKVPKLYNYFHYKDNEKFGSNRSIIINKYALSKLYNYILDIKPKLIISTFPVASQYVSKIKGICKLPIPFITCITDVVNGWEWITPNCNKYFVATEDVKNNMVDIGIEKDRIIVTGIPIRKEFLKSPKSLSNLSLPEEDSILTIMGGSMGLLPEDKDFYQWLDTLNNLTTLVLTGGNNHLFESISKWGLENIIPLKYVNEVAYIMAESDLLVTKAGGITLFEAIASNVPLIVYKPELGQELENTKFIQEKSIGEIAFNIDSLESIIINLLDDKSRIDEYKVRMDKVKDNINMKALAEECIKMINNQ